MYIIEFCRELFHNEAEECTPNLFLVSVVNKLITLCFILNMNSFSKEISYAHNRNPKIYNDAFFNFVDRVFVPLYMNIESLVFRHTCHFCSKHSVSPLSENDYTVKQVSAYLL
ncbi:unnamed protein product [Acanthoscelides obtectus]|uniref:Uncharacterized protein n=1 Tax=Acanthoscelides obtectus TaxID=200917 RepID=A0A9P0KWB7_ACAOB|nr:unnamed protein product [Acanthoscelides obtectus]CAK1624711.1 hypothetical protein AOBTE_LOCUS2715 [Acanthoscelides obtectus]